MSAYTEEANANVTIQCFCENKSDKTTSSYLSAYCFHVSMHGCGWRGSLILQALCGAISSLI
jgi:hypothetical protein